jgi:hypothetical protein
VARVRGIQQEMFLQQFSHFPTVHDSALESANDDDARVIDDSSSDRLNVLVRFAILSAASRPSPALLRPHSRPSPLLASLPLSSTGSATRQGSATSACADAPPSCARQRHFCPPHSRAT